MRSPSIIIPEPILLKQLAKMSATDFDLEIINH